MIFAIGLAMTAAGVLTTLIVPRSAFERSGAEAMPTWKALVLFAAWVEVACGCFLMLISMGVLAVRYLP